MKITTKNLQTMTKEQVYEIILPSVYQIYNQYKYAKKNEADYTNLVLAEIEASKDEYTGSPSYLTYMKKALRRRISGYIAKKLSTPGEACRIINDYIDEKIAPTFAENEILTYFDKLSKFLETYDFFPEPDILIDLLKNNKTLTKMAQTIFEKNKAEIIAGKIDTIFNNDFLIETVETYCMLEKIEIKEIVTNIEYEADYIGTDITKQTLRDIRQYKLLTPDEEKELAKRVAEGDLEARKLFIESNLRLVTSRAYKYLNNGLEYLDLVQEGMFGLMKAVDRYDVSKGYKFSTYAINWINQSIKRAVDDQGSTIRLPVHAREQLRLYKRVAGILKRELNRNPTMEEIAEATGLSLDQVKNLSTSDISMISLNEPLRNKKNEESDEMGDFIPNSEAEVFETVSDSILAEEVNNLLTKTGLNEREKLVLTHRYGLNGVPIMTLEEIGQQLNITRERVRQIESRAIKRLRNSRYIKDFAVYMDHPTEAKKTIDIFRELYATNKSNGNFVYKLLLRDGTLERIREMSASTIDSTTETEENTEKQQPDNSYLTLETTTETGENTVGNKDKRKKTLSEILEIDTETIKKLVSHLSEEETRILVSRYGENLEEYRNTNLQEKERTQLYSSILPKLRRWLEKGGPNPQKGRTNKLKESTTKVENIPVERTEKDANSLIPVEIPKEKSKNSTENVEKSLNISETIPEKVENTSMPVTKEKYSEINSEKSTDSVDRVQEKPKIEQISVIEKEDCERMLCLLRMPAFIDMMKETDPKTAIIMGLRIGYVDEKCFTKEAIANFLGMTEEEVSESIKKGVNIYKNNFDKFIDKLIDGSIDSANTPEAKYTVSTTSKQPTSQEKASYTKTRLASEKK